MEKTSSTLPHRAHRRGKTTLAGLCSITPRQIDRMGKVANSTTVMDYDEQEIQKDSISLACAIWNGRATSSTSSMYPAFDFEEMIRRFRCATARWSCCPRRAPSR